jgi:probable HAF family extracellular repeat protein
MSFLRTSAALATALSTLPGYNRSEAFGINGAQQVVGYSADANGFEQQAVLWNGTTPTSLGSLPGLTYTIANAINSSAMIVGSAKHASGYTQGSAFLWMNGQMFDLNSLISPTSGWQLTAAMDINDRGEIVGYGTLNNKGESFLLIPTIPIPEPSSMVLLIFGAIIALSLLRSEYSVHLMTRAGRSSFPPHPLNSGIGAPSAKIGIGRPVRSLKEMPVGSMPR